MSAIFSGLKVLKIVNKMDDINFNSLEIHFNNLVELFI